MYQYFVGFTLTHTGEVIYRFTVSIHELEDVESTIKKKITERILIISENYGFNSTDIAEFIISKIKVVSISLLKVPYHQANYKLK